MKVVNVEILPDGRMSARNAALYLGLSETTLAIKRSNGTGPRFTKIGRVFYWRADLDEWIAQHSGSSNAEVRERAAQAGSGSGGAP